MTADTLTSSADSIGKGARKPAFSGTAKPLVMRHYVYDFGTDVYAPGGEDISSIWDDFGTVVHISAEQMDTNSANDNRIIRVDYTGKKLLVYTAITTESTGVDQGVVSVSLMAFGY